MSTLMRFYVLFLTLAGITWAHDHEKVNVKGKSDFFTVNFDLYPKDHGYLPGRDLKIDPGLIDQCIDFSAIYNLTAPSRSETLYFPPEPPPKYDLRLYQDGDCSKPIDEDEWPWEPELEGWEWDFVVGYYRLTVAEPKEPTDEPQIVKPALPASE